MSSIKTYVRVKDGVADSISYDPDRDADGHLLPGWEGTTQEVFAGYIKTNKGWLAPEQPDAPPAPYVLGKTIPWRRMSETEAVKAKAAINDAPVKLQAIYEASSYLYSEDEFFQTLKDILSTLFTPERAEELLAPE